MPVFRRVFAEGGMNNAFHTDWSVVDVSLRPSEEDLIASSDTVDARDLMNY